MRRRRTPGIPAASVHPLLVLTAVLLLVAGCRDNAVLDPDELVPHGPSAKPLVTWSALTTGLPGGAVTFVRATPFGVFAGTSGGLVRLSPTRSHWSETDLTDRAVLALAVGARSGVLLALDGDQRVYRSENGVTWASVSAPEAPIGLVPGDGGSVVALGRRAAYRTVDGGQTWATQPLRGIAFDGGVTLLASTVVQGRPLFLASPQGEGLYTSPDGIGWRSVDALRGAEVTAAVATTDALVYVATARGPVYASGDGGTTWVPTTSEGLAQVRARRTSLASDSSGTIYLGTDGAGVFRSTDFGHTWVPFDGDPDVPSTQVAPHVTALEADGQDFLYAGATAQRAFVTAASTTGR